MIRFCTSNIVVFSLLIASNYLVACQAATSIPEPTLTNTPSPTATLPSTPTIEIFTTHPELEIITPNNVARLEQIDQWGQGNVNGIALSPKGNLIAISTTTGIYLYDRKTIKQIGYINIRVGEYGMEKYICPISGNLAFSPDGATLAIASTDITLWDLNANTVQTVIKNKVEYKDTIITNIRFSTDGYGIIAIQRNAHDFNCDLSWRDVMYTVETGEMSVLQPNNVKVIPQVDRKINFERQKQKLTVSALDDTVICSKPVDPQSTGVSHPKSFSSDGSIAISCDSSGYRAGDVRVWDLDQCTISKPVLIFPEVAREISFSSDGRSVLTGSAAGYTFHVFDVQTGQMRFSLSGFDAAFSADGNQVFVAEAEAVNAYDVETGNYINSVLKTVSDSMTDIFISPDGQFIVLTNDPSTRKYHFYKIDDGSLFNISYPMNGNNLYFSQNSQFMAISKHRPALNEIRFWKMSTGTELTNWQGMVPDATLSVNVEASFNSDFTQLATFSTNGYHQYVYIWSVPEFTLTKALTQFSNGDQRIQNLEFIANNQLFFARGVDPDMFLFWDLSTGELISEISAEVHYSMLGNPIVFSPDGRLITVVDGDGTIHVWGVKSP
jgi:WD40 repeat protein